MMFSGVHHSPSAKVFFIDTNGVLCARASGHALDVEGQSFPSSTYLLPEYITIHLCVTDGRLVLRHRRPLTQPYPNAYSHPLPRFRYNGATSLLTVDFEVDPAFAGGTTWRAKTFYVTAVHRRRQRTIIDEPSEALASALPNPFSLLAGAHPPAADPTAPAT